jgi:hypothetical protein
LSLRLHEEIIYEFTEELKITFLCNSCPVLETKDEVCRIPLLLDDYEISIALKNISAIKFFDFPFPTLCKITAGYLSFVLKYMCSERYAYTSSLSYTPH